MAGLSKRRDGSGWLLQFRAADGERKFISLGPEVDRGTANKWRHYVTQLAADMALGRPHDEHSIAWIESLGSDYLDKLHAVGLGFGMGVAGCTVSQLCTRFLEAWEDRKKGTRANYQNAINNLIERFGTRSVDSISQEDADGFRSWLKAEKLADATISRRILAARTVWKMATRWGIARRNVWAGVRAGSQTNTAKRHFVPVEVIAKVLDACPDQEWRTIFALARFGGLRVPSEFAGLKWGDILWDQRKMRVCSPKTAHHAGQDARWVPLFPELERELSASFARAKPGDEYVVGFTHRQSAANLRSHGERIVKKAGVQAWPKLWQNLRASRESELMRQYDLTTVCLWIGNSPAIAAAHYAMSRNLDADFAQAASQPTEGSGKVVLRPVLRGDEPSDTATNRPENQNEQKPNEINETVSGDSMRFEAKTEGLGITGFEPVTSCVSCMRSNQLS